MKYRDQSKPIRPPFRKEHLERIGQPILLPCNNCFTKGDWNHDKETGRFYCSPACKAEEQAEIAANRAKRLAR